MTMTILAGSRLKILLLLFDEFIIFPIYLFFEIFHNVVLLLLLLYYYFYFIYSFICINFGIIISCYLLIIGTVATIALVLSFCTVRQLQISERVVTISPSTEEFRAYITIFLFCSNMWIALQ